MKLTIPELSLVVLIGPSGSGKSTFAARHFKPTEVLSSDFCRGLVSDDESSLEATSDAFEILRIIAARRLARGKLTVIDATNVQLDARRPWIELAREYHCLPIALVLDVSEKTCRERNRNRADRDFGSHVLRQQCRQMRSSLRRLDREGFRRVHVIAPDVMDLVEIEREPLWNNRKSDHGPFDIVGDIHGCHDELQALLAMLGYEDSPSSEGHAIRRHPAGRKVVFLGDLVDRGPDIPGTLKLAMSMVEAGTALCVPGNHDLKLMRKLRGKNVKVSHGLDRSLEQLEREPPEFKAKVADFIDALVSHYVLDDGKLVVAHAGMKESMQGRGSGKVREFALYGETTGETDEYGLPVRYNWASEYRGTAMVVYGHTPVPEAEWLNNTICIDTGCVFGGMLTALRYPEREIVSVPAARVYCEPARPIEKPQPPTSLSAQHDHDDVLDIDDVGGKRIISTRLHHNITVRADNAAAALEVMSRFAANPKWLIYLPPTMSPSETSPRPGLLEHPDEAFESYRRAGIERVICEEKHMGSRAIVIVCRDRDAARRIFGVVEDEIGVCYTRTGRRFFGEPKVEAQVLERIRASLEESGFWKDLNTDWVCLDCELMPWSIKAQELLRDQYAAVGSAGHAAIAESIAVLERARENGMAVDELLESARRKLENVHRFTAAYRRYCWTVKDLEDIRIAPFHLLATEGTVHVDKDHTWHMEMLAKLRCDGDSILMATSYKIVDLNDEASCAEATTWWKELTGRGGEGMVVKPLTFVARSRRGLVQPAIKCRGPEYLRIIYGPDYPDHIDRLRARGLSVKRSLALRELALGIEALERFVRRDPLRRVHECVFAILALESEPVDPRL